MSRRIPIRLIASPFFVLLVAACAGRVPHNLPGDYAIDSDQHYGVIIGSVGAKRDPGMDSWYEWSLYELRSKTDSNLSGHVNSAFKWNPYYMWGSMALCPDDGLADECGQLFALLLPAGEYEFHMVIPAMSSKSTDQSFRQSGWSAQLQGYDFEVLPGKAIYLGNLISRICIAAANHGNRVWSAVGDVSDESKRDIPLLINKFPNLASVPILQQTMDVQPWLWRYKEAEGVAPVNGWPPDCTLDNNRGETYLRSQ